MAGYRIFKATSINDAIVDQTLAEIGMSKTQSTMRFSDGKEITYTAIGDSSGKGFWFVADDDAHLFIEFPDDNRDNIFFHGKSTTSYGSGKSFPLTLIAEDIDGNLVAYNGENSSSSVAKDYCNLPTMNYQNNDNPLKNDLRLHHFVYSFVYGNPYAVPTTFKSLFVNYYRYFNFGDIIVDSNNNRYIAMGWVLHKIGG